MDLSSRRSRFGLSGMRERVEMSGGTFELASAPGQGFRFSVRLPAGEGA
jgi:signal transduction histidine kinase